MRFIGTPFLAFVLVFGMPVTILADDEQDPPPEEQTSADTQESPPEEQISSDTQEAPPEEATEGNPGNDGGESSEAIVETGDATTTADVENEINTNVIDTTGDATSTEPSDEPAALLEEEDGEATTTPETFDVLQSDNATTTPVTATTTTTTATSTNTATTTNTVVAEAATGGNGAGGSGGAAIVTGDAHASANVVNVVNTNIFNSTGFLYFFNLLLGLDSFDLRDKFAFFDDNSGTENSPCDLDACGDDIDYHIGNDNTATITNTVIVRSSTGGNTATSTDGSAYVKTGDARAAANIVNVANTNLTNSNYLLLALNNPDDVRGDIVLPSRDFFERFFARNNAAPRDITVHNDNKAVVDNDVVVEADTGGNSASGDGDGALVVTGNAQSNAGVTNVINTNTFNTNTFLMLIRVHGDWSGDVFGLPPGISWAETPYGIQLFSEDVGLNDATTTNTGSGGSFDVDNENAALIRNNVQVYALTGENKATSTGSGALIETGDADASANIFNLVNTNVLGRNLSLLMFNIFGDWSGNLSFGQSNLWLGGSAQSRQSPIRPDTDVTYTFDITNNGDADATDVRLNALFDPALVDFTGSQPSEEEGMAETHWELGTVPAGETREFSYDAVTGNDFTYGDTPVTLTAEVTSHEPDADESDNTELVTLAVNNPPPAAGAPSTGVTYTPDPVWSITKASSATSTITASSTVDYTITIQNDGGPAYHSVLVDTIVDEAGDVVHEESWDLDEILPDEEITVTYTAVFSASTTPGVYRNNAQVLSIGRNPSVNPFYGYFSDSPVASTTLEVIGDKADLVPAPKPECEAYLVKFIRPRATNDPAEVRKLQQFLVDFEGFSDLAVTGEYDQKTLEAVKEFQERYSNDILGPWGLERDTGIVYFTTRKKINEIYCAGQKFPLTDKQNSEISTFRSLIERLRLAAAEAAQKKDLADEGEGDETSIEKTATQADIPRETHEFIAGAAEAVNETKQSTTSILSDIGSTTKKVLFWVFSWF